MTPEFVPEHELKQRAAALAAVDDGGGRGRKIALIAIAAGDRLYAIPIEQVVEVMPAARVCPVPGGSAVFEGIVNYRGDIVPVVSLAAFFDHPGGRPQGIIVVASANGAIAALVSGETPRLLDVAADAIRGAEAGHDGTSPAVRGFIEDAGRTIAVVALEHIMRPGVFTTASSGQGPGPGGDVR